MSELSSGARGDGVRLYTVMYGPHPALHTRLADSLERELPQHVPMEIYLNAVPSVTVSRVDRLYLGRPGHLYSAREPGKKYPLMREMFQPLKEGRYPECKWVVWFDDDAHILPGHDWWNATVKWIEMRAGENICYAGQCWFIHWKAGQPVFIRSAPWYKRTPPALVGNRKKFPGIEFAQGSYWWLRRDVLEILDWPDPRIVHNGGDTMLAEAVRQHCLPFHKMPHHCFGVKTNDAPRRGYHEAPAGCVDKKARA